MKKSVKKAGPRLAIVAADFHEQLTIDMLAAANAEAEALGARVLETLRVPGCYETPLIADRLLSHRRVDAVVVLGCIERGETLHGEVMGHVVHRALVEASLRHDKPVGLGIIGPGATPEQAEARKDSTPRTAVRAVLRSLSTSTELSPKK